MQDATLVHKFCECCAALQSSSGADVRSANEWLILFQESPVCADVCLLVLSQTLHNFPASNASVRFMAAKLLHSNLHQKALCDNFTGILFVNEYVSTIARIAETVLSALMLSDESIDFAIRRQLSRCLSTIIVMEFCIYYNFVNISPPSFLTDPCVSGSALTTLVAAAQASPDVLCWLVYVLEEIPNECLSTKANNTAVRQLVKACGKFVTGAVVHYASMGQMRGVANALNCALIWTKAQYSPDVSAGGSASWLSMHEMTSFQENPDVQGGSMFVTLLNLLVYLQDNLASNSLSMDESEILVCLLDIFGELIADPILPINVIHVSSNLGNDCAIGCAVGVLIVFSALHELWRKCLHLSLEDWFCAAKDCGEPFLKEQYSKLKCISTENNKRVFESLVEVSVLLSERHADLLVSAHPFYEAARISASTNCTLNIPIVLTDIACNARSVYVFHLAALLLPHLPATAPVLEALHRPLLNLADSTYNAQRGQGLGDKNYFDQKGSLETLARELLPIFLVVLRLQLACPETPRAQKRKSGDIFAEDGGLQENVLFLELGKKHRDSKLQDAAHDDDETLTEWLVFRCESFQLLQGLSTAWPGGSHMLHFVHDTLILQLTELQTTLAALSAGSSLHVDTQTLSVVALSRKSEALLFIWHALVETSFSSNSYDIAHDHTHATLGVTSGANASNDGNDTHKAMRLLRWTTDIASHIYQLVKSETHLCVHGLVYRSAKLLALLPDVIGFHLPRDMAAYVPPTTVHARDPAVERYAERQIAVNIQQVLELLCVCYENSPLSREACVEAFFALTNGRGLRALLQPHAMPLAEWLEAALGRAHQEVAARDECHQLSTFPRDIWLSDGAPVHFFRFSHKLSVVLGRTATWLSDTQMELSTTRILSTVMQALEDSRNVFQSAFQSASLDVVAQGRVRRALGSCKYFLDCAEGLLRGLGDASSATDHAEDFDNAEHNNTDSINLYQYNQTRFISNILARVVPALVSGLIELSESLLSLLRHDPGLPLVLNVGVNALIANITKTICKVFERPDSMASFATIGEEISEFLLSRCNRFLTVVVIDSNRETYSNRYLGALEGLLELTIGSIRWAAASQAAVVQQAFLSALSCETGLFGIRQYLAACDAYVTNFNSEVHLASPSVACLQDVKCLSALLRVLRQFCTSWPALIQRSSASQIRAMHVFGIAARFLVVHFDAALLRQFSAAWSALWDAALGTSSGDVPKDGAHSDLAQFCFQDGHLMNIYSSSLSTLIMGGIILPSPRLLKPCPALVASAFEALGALWPTHAILRLTEMVCEAITQELMRRNQWPNDSLTSRVQAVRAAFTQAVCSNAGSVSGVNLKSALVKAQLM